MQQDAQIEVVRGLTYAKTLVFEYVKARLEKTDRHITFALDEVYVVWFCKTLKNWKALVSTTLPDGMYYEVTYDGENARTYIDAYKKFDNVAVIDKEYGPQPEFNLKNYNPVIDGVGERCSIPDCKDEHIGIRRS